MKRETSEQAIAWKRYPVLTNQREDENVGEEFFNDVDTLDEISSLVRESIQNSIDARRNNKEPVIVRFTIGSSNPENNSKYFKEIISHAKKSIYESLVPNLSIKSKFLVIEDFNTYGLKGSINSSRPTEESSEIYGSNFWFFEWKSGETNKLAGGRGSWGIGKAVLSAASRLKTILVQSERSEEFCPEKNTKSILFGHSIFKYANVDGVRLGPHRTWMIEKILDGKSVHMPSSDPHEIASFRRDWLCTRNTGEIGTSIVIPFIKDSINSKRLVQCIIQDYFIAILEDVLTCEVINERSEKISLSKDSLISHIRGIDEEDWPSAGRNKEELIGFCNMYKSKMTKTSIMKTIKTNYDSINDWSAVIFTDEDKIEFQSKLEAGICLEFIVKTEVPTDRIGNYISDEFYVLLAKAPNENMSKTLFTRQGIIIPEAHRDSKLVGLLSMVIIDEGKSNSLQKMLRDSEGPAHKNWTPRGDKVHSKYEARALKKTINWVKTSALTIHKKLQPDQSIADDRSLAKYFPDDEPIAGSYGELNGEDEPKTGRPEGGQGGSGGKGVPRGGRLLRVERGDVMGSIRILPIDSSKISIGMKFEIETAYALRGGDSFSAWDEEDFNLESLYSSQNSFGVSAEFIGNKAIIEVSKENFSVLFQGFDANRDLSIESKRIQ